MFEQLKGFRKIGWDFDGTIHEHPLAEQFHRFIIENPYDQEHHIITFRSGGYELYIPRELEKYVTGLLVDQHFLSLETVPHDYWVNNKMSPIILLDDPYLKWKGLRCKELGIEVLIDDDTHAVKMGCGEHGIVHIHPDDLG